MFSAQEQTPPPHLPQTSGSREGFRLEPAQSFSETTTLISTNPPPPPLHQESTPGISEISFPLTPQTEESASAPPPPLQIARVQETFALTPTPYKRDPHQPHPPRPATSEPLPRQ